MDNNPTAAGEAPQAPQTEATPTPTTNPESAQAPDMHGFSSDELAGLRTWLDSNGGFDKVKSRLSNPQNYQPVQAPEPQQTASAPQPQAPAEPQYKAPEGSITAQEFLAQQYFQSLSRDPKYEAISDAIAKGEVLKGLADFNIQLFNPDGSINDMMVRRYLDKEVRTVPAKPTGTEPGMSNAPTVEYYQVAGDNITNMNDAYNILMQDSQLKASGQAGHPLVQAAEEFIRTGGKPAEKK